MKADYEHIAHDRGASLNYFFLKKKYFDFYWHYHPEIELTCILKGEGTRLVGDHIGEYRENDLVLLGPNIPHSWQSRGNGSSKTLSSKAVSSKALVIHFARELLSGGMLDLPEFGTVGHLIRESEGGIRFTGLSARRGREKLLALHGVSDFRRLTGVMDVLDYLARTGEWVRLSSEGYHPSLNRKTEQRLDRVLSFIHSAYRNTIRLSDLAGIAGMNESAFSRFFHGHTGKPPVAYLNEVRIRQVCQMLMHTGETIAYIAFSCGYNNLTHFNRQFKKLNRCSPVEYRKRRKGG